MHYYGSGKPGNVTPKAVGGKEKVDEARELTSYFPASMRFFW